MPVPSNFDDLLDIIQENLFDNNSGLITEPNLRFVLEQVSKYLDIKTSLASPTLNSEQLQIWQRILDLKQSDFYGSILQNSAFPPTGDLWGIAAPGTYSNTGGINVSEGKVGFVSRKSGVWTKVEIQLPSLSLAETYDKSENTKAIAPAKIENYLFGYDEDVASGQFIEQDFDSLTNQMSGNATRLIIVKPNNNITSLIKKIKIKASSTGNFGMSIWKENAGVLTRDSYLAISVVAGVNTIDLPEAFWDMNNRLLALHQNGTTLTAGISFVTSTAATHDYSYYTTSVAAGTTVNISSLTHNTANRIGIQFLQDAQTVTHDGRLKELFNHKKDLFNYQNFTIAPATSANKRFDHGHIVQTTNGLLAIMQRMATSTSDYTTSNLVTYRSHDNGESWILDQVKTMHTFGATRTPFAEANPDIYKKKDGSFVVFYVQSRTTDTTNRALIKCKLSPDGTTFTDHVIFASDAENLRPSSGGGVRFSDGNLYWVFYAPDSTGGSSSGDSTAHFVLYKSTDDGETWTNISGSVWDTNTSATAVFEPFVFELPNNNICVGYRTLQSYCRARISSDGGDTWGDSFNLFKAPNSMSCVKRISGIDNQGDIILKYYAASNFIMGDNNSDHAINRKKMQLLYSEDGVNWTQKIVFQKDSAIYAGSFEPSISIINNVLFCAWSEYNTTAKGMSCNLTKLNI